MLLTCSDSAGPLARRLLLLLCVYLHSLVFSAARALLSCAHALLARRVLFCCLCGGERGAGGRGAAVPLPWRHLPQAPQTYLKALLRLC
jgi:hypothetical protein